MCAYNVRNVFETMKQPVIDEDV